MPRGFAGEERREAREAAEAADRLMDRQAERQMRMPVAMVDAPTEYVREVMPQAVADIGAARAVQGATSARQEALRGASLLEKAPAFLQSAMNLLGYNPRESALAQTERLMLMPGATFMNGRITAPIAGAVGAFGRPASLNQGMFGNVTYTGMPYAGYPLDAPFSDLIRGPVEERPGGAFQPVTDSVTEEPTTDCPPGYRYDPVLKSCVVSFEPTFYQPTQSFGFEDLGLLGTYSNTLLG